jgi:hypothetical protein
MFNKLETYKNDILNYCKVNNIEDIDLFVKQCFKQGFDIKKYGFLGKTDEVKERIVEVEVIKEVEKIVEVVKEIPIETIKEVEKIVEVPVEKVVTKIEYISDKTNEDELVLKIQELEENMSKKENELDEVRRNLDELRRKLDDKVDNPNDKTYLLQETLQKLRKTSNEKDDEILKLKNIINELEKALKTTGAVFMKNSNINDNI